MAHTARISHQYKTISSLKENLSESDTLIHMDFGENFTCKYGREPQSVHFGASREQITLHTGVLYIKSLKQSFCTLSTSLKHDSSAIISHVTPILTAHLKRNASDLHSRLQQSALTAAQMSARQH